jgi:hypothetical protein
MVESERGLGGGRRLSFEEFEARRAELIKDKKVREWPEVLDPDRPGGGLVVNLTVSECTWLGGTVVHWPYCGTLMKCVGPSGREMCIDKVQ